MHMNGGMLATILIFIFGNSYAAIVPASRHYVVSFETGDKFDVQLTDSSITWKGLKGSDKDHVETDAIKHKNLSDTVEIIQYIEKSGIFVTLVLDKTHRKIISSGKTAKDTWLIDGVLE